MKPFEEKDLKKVFKESDKLVFLNRVHIITDGHFLIKCHSTVKFTEDILKILFANQCKKDKYFLREFTGLNLQVFSKILPKQMERTYMRTKLILDIDKYKCIIYKDCDSGILTGFDVKYDEYLSEYMYGHTDISVCYDSPRREDMKIAIMPVSLRDLADKQGARAAILKEIEIPPTNEELIAAIADTEDLPPEEE